MNYYTKYFYLSKSFLLTVFLFLIFNSSSYSQQKDFEIEVERKFIIDGDIEDGYSLVEEQKREIKFVSKSSTKTTYHHFFNSYKDEITDFYAEFRRKGYYKRHLSLNSVEPENVFISSYNYYTLVLPNNIKKSEVLSYKYTREYSSLNYLPLILIDNKNHYKSYKIIIEYPDDVEIDFEINFAKEKIDYEIISEPDDNLKSIIFKNVKHKKDLVYLEDDILATIIILPTLNKNLITPYTKNGIAHWYDSIAELHPKLHEQDLVLIPDIIKNAKSKEKKLKQIHKFITEEFRYVAELQDKNSYVPRSPSIVLKRKFGDCKEMSSLFSAIALSQGIETYLTLVPKSEIPQSSYVLPGFFNHMIIAYLDNDKMNFLDLTANYVQFESLPESIIGEEVFVLDSLYGGYHLVNDYHRTPGTSIQVNTHVDSLGKAKAKIKFSGYNYGQIKYILENFNQEDRENFLSNYCNNIIQKISFDYFKLINKTEDHFEFVSTVDLSNFLIKSKNKIYVTSTPFNIFDREILSRKNDDYPIDTVERLNIQFMFTIQGDSLLLKSNDIDIGNNKSGIQYSSQSHTDSNRITFNYKILQSQKRFSNKQKNEVLDFSKKYFRSKNKINTILLPEAKNE